MSQEWQEFMRQQRMIICSRLGHSWAMPIHGEIKITGEEIEVLCLCKTCGSESWQKIDPEKRKAFVEALKSEASIAAFFFKG
jgi:hypothetical protein